MKSVICGIDFHRGTNAPSTFHRGAMIDGSRGFQPTGAFQPTGINAPNSPRRGATVDAMASCGVARGFMRRAATRSVYRIVIRGLKPTVTITMSLRDKEAVPGRGATIDGSRAFQRPDHRVSYFPRRGATVDAMASCGVARGFMRRAATPIIFGTMIRGLKPTATITMSLRDEDAMPMAAVERAMRIQKNMEGFGV